MATMTEKLEKALQKNLDKQVKDNDAPQSIAMEGLFAILLDLLLGLFEQCLEQNSRDTLAGRIKKLRSYQKSQLRRKIKRKAYGNSTRRYSNEGGKYVLAACVQTAEDAGNDEVDDFVDEVDSEGLINYETF